MMANTSPPNFSIIQAGHRWINSDGTPTQVFFRLIVNMFLAGGAGSPPSVTDVTNITLSQNPINGRDYDRVIADLTTIMAALPNPAGRIAALERRVTDLETINQQLQRTVDLNPMQKQIDTLTALVMA